MFNIIKLFLKLLLYKFLLINLNVFKRFLFEKHFYLFNKFINLYGPSSVSTEFRKVFFSKENDKFDELYGDSNFFLNSKMLLNYLKIYNRLNFNLLNFDYLLRFRQYNRSLFFTKIKKKLINLKNYKNLLIIFKKPISLMDILFEKLKISYSKKSFFSYIYIYIQFIILLIKILFINLQKNFKINNNFQEKFLIKKQNKVNLEYYFKFRLIIFNQYLLIKNDLKKIIDYSFFLIIFLKKIDLFLIFFNQQFFKNLIFFKKLNFVFFFSYLHFFYYCYAFLVNLKNLLNFKNLVIIKIFLFLKSLNFIININYKIFLNKLYHLIFFFFKRLIFLVYNFFLILKFVIVIKFFYFYKQKIFYKFLYFFIRKRNIAYINLLGILFTIKKDLKKRYTILMSQTKARQPNDLKDLNFYENINNVIAEEKNKDFHFLTYLAIFLKKKNKMLFLNKFFFTVDKREKRNFRKKFNKLKTKKFYKKKKFDKLKNFCYVSFFSKYLYNISTWLFLLKNQEKKNLLYFILRKLFFYKYIKNINFRKIIYFINLNNLLKIKYYRLTQRVKLFSKDFDKFLLKKKKLKKKLKFKKNIKFWKVDKKIFLNFNYDKKKRRLFSYQIYKNKFCLSKGYIKKLVNKKKRIKRKKKIKLFFLLNFFSYKHFNFNKSSLLIKNFLLIKLKKKKKLKKLKILRKKYLNLYGYKFKRNRKKLNFINFFEQPEKYLTSQKLFSLYISKYKLNSWFNDLHNYTFFHKYFILKRDRFWYSVSRRESILKYHDGRNMLADVWDENFLLQQKSLFFFKEGYQTFFIQRNNFNSLSSLKFLEVIETSVLKKHGFLILFWKIIFFSLLLLLFCYFFLQYILLFQYNLLISYIILSSLFPIILNFFIKSFFYSYKVSKICLRLFLRKAYFKNYNIFFFRNFFAYFLQRFFLKKKKINFFVSNFYGYLILSYLKNLEKKKSIFLLFVKMIFVILFFSFLLFVVSLFQILNILVFYDFFYKIFSYYTFIFFNNLFINFILFYFIYLLFTFCIFYFNFLNNNILLFIAKIFFNDNFNHFINFLNYFLFKQNNLKNLHINEINEQVNILKNIKTQQYIRSCNNLKKNAI